MLLQCVGLAAVGTIADVVPLLDENRVYVKYGLKCLREKGGPGVTRLLKLAKLSDKSSLNSEDIAFRFAPRLNAAGRLGQAGCGIELLTTSDTERATTLANYLHELNGQRETEERSIQLAATKQVKETCDPDADPALVLAGRGWHAGVIGIVAGRLAERWHRPVVMLARDELQAKPAIGSVRSVPGFDVHAALMACRELLITCGGHAAAAGLRIEDKKIDAFRKAFLSEVAARMPKELRQAQIQLDGETTLAGVTLQSIGELERLAPFGQGNKRPLLCASGVTCAEPPRTMGNGDKHMSVTLLQNGVRIRAVAFGGAEWIPHLPPPGEPFHIAFKPKINEFRGRRTAELELLDWRPDGIDVSVDLPPMADATA
jgi:single-stranded-DNA-specific exonuclease